MDLVLRLDVAVFGDAEVHANAGLVDGLPDEAGVAEGFAGTIDGNRPDARTVTDFLPLLPLGGIEVTDPSGVTAHVPDVDFGDACLTSQEVGAELREGIPVGGGEADPSDDNAGLGGHLATPPIKCCGAVKSNPPPLALANWGSLVLLVFRCPTRSSAPSATPSRPST
jgi:hypothetical protein